MLAITTSEDQHAYHTTEAGVVVVRTPNAMQQMEAFDMNTGKFLWKNNNTVFDVDVQIEGYSNKPKRTEH